MEPTKTYTQEEVKHGRMMLVKYGRWIDSNPQACSAILERAYEKAHGGKRVAIKNLIEWVRNEAGIKLENDTTPKLPNAFASIMSRHIIRDYPIFKHEIKTVSCVYDLLLSELPEHKFGADHE